MSTSDQVRIALEELASSSLARYRTAEDRITAVVRDAVSAGVFLPGQRLPQDTLASLLNVSRMPVRAALRRLESEGLVDLIPHRGALVRTMSRDEIQETQTFANLDQRLRSIEAHGGAESAVELDHRHRTGCSSTGFDKFLKTFAVGELPRRLNVVFGQQAPFTVCQTTVVKTKGRDRRSRRVSILHEIHKWLNRRCFSCVFGQSALRRSGLSVIIVA